MPHRRPPEEMFILPHRARDNQNNSSQTQPDTLKPPQSKKQQPPVHHLQLTRAAHIRRSFTNTEFHFTHTAIAMCKTKDVTMPRDEASVTVGGWVSQVLERVFEDCGRPTCERSKACTLPSDSEKRKLKFLEAWKPEDGFNYKGSKEDKERDLERYLLEQEEKKKKNEEQQDLLEQEEEKNKEQQGQGQGQ
ncbi:hypothetical protein QBC32DRAFT_392754 [Pseudoneurospora amorphoporcata]|uniref:Uncharacterized protein n=1 Tax=Pseudoneurospora amorphoporcata TaxID=241081 RepID=A0AAN6NUK3_9PEZI|nr:hypothetical protein QBC32DRAFT_392754 [Pseudoneurospora amorphoporcata]